MSFFSDCRLLLEKDVYYELLSAKLIASEFRKQKRTPEKSGVLSVYSPGGA